MAIPRFLQEAGNAIASEWRQGFADSPENNVGPPMPTATVPPQSSAGTSSTGVDPSKLGANVANELNPQQRTTTATQSTTMALPLTQRTTETITGYQSGKTVPQFLQNQLVAEGEKQKAANTQIAENEYKRGMREAEFYKGLQDQTDLIEERKLAQKEETDRQVKQSVDKLQALIQDYQQSEVDPNKFFKEAGPGGSVLALIGQAFSAAGATLARTENYGQAIINNAINRSIDAQKAAISKKQSAVALQNNLVAHFIRQGEDVDSAALAAKQVLLEQTKRLIAAEAAKTDAANAPEKAKALNAGVDKEITDTRVQQELQKQGTFSKQEQTKTTPIIAPGFKDIGDVQDFAAKSPEIKEYKDARAMARNWESAMKAGADGVGVSEFIATGLKQGSFNENFVDLLRKRGMVDAAGNFLREKFMGGYDPALLTQIGGTINNRLAAATQGAQGPMQAIPAQYRSIILGSPTTSDKAAALGAKRLE